MIHQKCVIVTLPVLLLGGTEMQTLQQVRVLVTAGYQVTVCCFYQHDESMRNEMEKAGALVVLLGADSSDGLLSLLRLLVPFFQRLRPDIVHVQYIAPGFIPVLAARLAGVHTVFATVHQPGHPYGRKARILLRIAAFLCTTFFCNSLSVERSWFGNAALFEPQSPARRRHWTIYNAVDAENISSLAASIDAPTLRRQIGLGQGPVIGCIGRLRHEKGQSVLLDAMPGVIRAFPDAMLLMVGDGPDRVSLKQKAEVLLIDRKIVWMGSQSAEDVFRLLGVMDVVVVPSHFEGFGLVAAEAMAAGVPVIATNVDGLSEVVENGRTGFLVPPGDIEALAVVLLRMLSDHLLSQEFSERGHRRCRELFSINQYRNTMLYVYQDLGRYGNV